MFSVETFQVLESCVFYAVVDCQPFHLLKISAFERLQNGHILISQSLRTQVSEPLLWLWHRIGSVLDTTVNCYFKRICAEFESYESDS